MASIISAPFRYTNPNLLDNWFFAGGGSQQGGGQFPINQRGQTVYSNGSGYGIDRWWSIFMTSTLQSAGLKIESNLSSQYAGAFRQAIGSPSALAGKTVTLSVLVNSVSQSLFVSIVKATGMNAGLTTITGSTLTITSAGLHTMTVTLPSDVGGSSYPYLLIGFSTPINQNATIVAVKLELGTQQTLCYWNGSAWQLWEVPYYIDQMLRCQRYQYVFTGRGYVSWAFGMGWNTSTARVLVPLPVSMRSVSGLTSFLSGSLADLLIYANGGYEVPTAIDQTVVGCNEQTASITFTVPNQAWGQFCMLSAINANARILFDCNY